MSFYDYYDGEINQVEQDNLRRISLHSIFEFWISDFISNSEKNRVQNQQDFISSSKLIFAGYTGSKNQVRTRQKIEFVSNSIFFRVWNWKKIKWHSIFLKSSANRQGESLQYSFCQLHNLNSFFYINYALASSIRATRDTGHSQLGFAW